MAESKTLIDFSKTQRIVVVIDLDPLLKNPNPKPYLNSIIKSIQRLLNFDPISSSSASSLFAFKLFFSSLSPILSSSKLYRIIGKSAATFSFNRPLETIDSLLQTLNLLSNVFEFESIGSRSDLVSETHNSVTKMVGLDDSQENLATETLDSEVSGSRNEAIGSTKTINSSARGCFVASSLLQIAHHYSWEPQIRDLLGMENEFCVVPSNLIVLFSSVPGSAQCLSEFMNVEISGTSMKNIDAFCEKFVRIFGTLNDAFVSREVHFSWVDVNYESERSKIDESGLNLRLFKGGIKKFGWGFCSTDSIVLGSTLVPFGLIYPNIGVPTSFLKSSDSRKRIRAQLSLELLDVSGKPLECKCCCVDLVSLKTLPRNRFDNVSSDLDSKNLKPGGYDDGEAIWKQLGDGRLTLCVKAVHGYAEGIKVEGNVIDTILVHVSSGESRKDQTESYVPCFADRVIEILANDSGEVIERRSIPTWQILLTFLYRERHTAWVSVSNGNGDIVMGILKPFTVHSAFLSIVRDGLIRKEMVQDLDEPGLANEESFHMSQPDGFNSSQSEASSSKNNATLEEGKTKKGKKRSKLHKDLTWPSFYKAAFNHLEMNLEDVYFSRDLINSKKLKFLKCWMKQIRKSSSCCQNLPEESKPREDILKDVEERLTGWHNESEQPLSSPVLGMKEPLAAAPRSQEEAGFVSCSESLDAFVCNISEKLQQGLESKGVDLRDLAERLVNSSISWLYKKHEIDTSAIRLDNASDGVIVAELIKLLLQEPKDLAAKNKDKDPPSPETLVREYELQILFRMEILCSEVAESIGESTKQKFVKQICSLLEFIQYHMEGGFFGDSTLENYVGRTIKSRYSQALADTVDRIYRKMDLLLFTDIESPNPLLISEDSNHSWKEKRDSIGENDRTNEPNSGGDSSSQPWLHRNGEPQKLMEAQERRERARRFASFTSWVPDLQKVWAPKQQPKLTRAKSDSYRKEPKRKDKRRMSYDFVCETPMTGLKRSCSRTNSIDDKDRNSSPGSGVAKALFQDD